MPSRCSKRRLIAVAALALSSLAAAGAGGTAAGAGHERFTALDGTGFDTNVSSNWAGYVVSQTGTTYTSVTATWKEPTVICGADDAGEASAFWVGLGGSSVNSEALEQVGTSSDCNATTGRPTYYAWYELVPANSVTIRHLIVHAGDTVTTSVNVLGGTTIELQVKNRTRGTSFTTKLPYANPDLSSAEWIAEAPSTCDSFRCREIPLSNFGSVSFTNIAAIGNSVGGTLTANPGWTSTAISLVPDGSGRGYYPGPDQFASRANSTAGATPTAASTDGRSFAVQWTANAAAA